MWLEYCRCEDYAISLLEQCEDLREVEVFLQTKYSGNKDANYILAILGEIWKSVYRWKDVIKQDMRKWNSEDSIFLQRVFNFLRGKHGWCRPNNDPITNMWQYNTVYISTKNIFSSSDSRMKFVAHERFQYVLLNKFGEEHNWIINNWNILTK